MENYIQWKLDNLCPHTTNPLQLRTVCKRCVREADITELDLKMDVCNCGHNIHEHEAVNDYKCYVYGCQCDGFESDID